MVAPTLWLSCHVDYACRNSGACCRAGWPLPVESRVAGAIAAAVAGGRLTTIDRRRAWLVTHADAPAEMAGTLRQAGGACVFHRPRVEARQRFGEHECAVHATLGHAALPATCQHFPRVCLVDDRGVRVSLSHVCPTALSMLADDPRPLTIVAGPSAVPGLDVPEGLDARGQLPPRLTDRVLMGWEGLSAWEAHVVAALAGPSADRDVPEDVLGRLAAQADRLVEWTPRNGSFAAAVDRLPANLAERRPLAPIVSVDDDTRRRAAVALVRAACRPPWTRGELPETLPDVDRTFVRPGWAAQSSLVRRYLGARAFGAWVPYRLDAARGLIRWLGLVLDIVRVECATQCGSTQAPLTRADVLEAIRETDRLLLHHADDAVLAALLQDARAPR